MLRRWGRPPAAARKAYLTNACRPTADTDRSGRTAEGTMGFASCAVFNSHLPWLLTEKTVTVCPPVVAGAEIEERHDDRLDLKVGFQFLWKRMPRYAAWNPRQVSSENVDCERRCHEDRSYPESPVTMHTPPVRPWIGFTAAATISDEYSPLRAALLQCAR